MPVEKATPAVPVGFGSDRFACRRLGRRHGRRFGRNDVACVANRQARHGGSVVRTRTSAQSLMAAAARDKVILAGDGDGGIIFPDFQPGMDGLYALATEGVTLDFDEASIDELALLAEEINTAVENIGARRLHTILERLLEEISFTASDRPEGTLIEIDRGYVRDKVGALAQNADLSRFIL